MKAFIMKRFNAVITILVGVGILLGSLPMIEAAEKPKPGGTFVSGLWADPDTLNPAITSQAPTRMVTANIFSRLLYVDINGDYIGDLAEKWTISNDNLRIRFDLRKGAKWHDGRPVTAEDVKFSLESLAKYHPRGIELKRISEISVLSENSLEIKFPSPSIPFFPFLDEAGFILPKHIYGTSQNLTLHPSNRNPIGSGPFTFQEWKQGDHITLIKNKDYFIRGEPFVDRAVFKITPSGASRVLSLETGETDYLAERGLPEADVPRLLNNPNFVLTDRGMGSTSLILICFNTRRKPWDDVRVRRAVAHSIDRKVIVEKGTFGLAKPAYSPFSKMSFPWAYNPKSEEMYPLDLDKAAKLLDEAGYPMGPGGVRLRSTLFYDRGDTASTDICEVLRQQLKKVGIDILLQPLDKPTVNQRVFMAFDFDLYTGSAFQGADPSIGIDRIFIKEGMAPVPSFHNANEYSNPEADRLFLLGRMTFDQKKRGEYYREVQLILLKDLPILPLTDLSRFAAFKKTVRGVHERRQVSHYYAPSDAWFSE